jgi:hypothetical protein
MKKLKVPFKDFKTKHKVFITVVNMAILITGGLLFLSYSTAHPDQEVLALLFIFVPTCILMVVCMLLMSKSFQKYYDHPRQGG